MVGIFEYFFCFQFAECFHYTGCPEIIQIRNRSVHEKNCGYVFVTCTNNPNCPRLRKMNLESHLAQCQHRQCPNHLFTCTFVGTMETIHRHLEEDCKFEPIKTYLCQSSKEMDQVREILNDKENEIISLKTDVSQNSLYFICA